MTRNTSTYSFFITGLNRVKLKKNTIVQAYLISQDKFLDT